MLQIAEACNMKHRRYRTVLQTIESVIPLVKIYCFSLTSNTSDYESLKKKQCSFFSVVEKETMLFLFSSEDFVYVKGSFDVNKPTQINNVIRFFPLFHTARFCHFYN